MSELRHQNLPMFGIKSGPGIKLNKCQYFFLSCWSRSETKLTQVGEHLKKMTYVNELNDKVIFLRNRTRSNCTLISAHIACCLADISAWQPQVVWGGELI